MNLKKFRCDHKNSLTPVYIKIPPETRITFDEERQITTEPCNLVVGWICLKCFRFWKREDLIAVWIPSLGVGGEGGEKAH